MRTIWSLRQKINQLWILVCQSIRHEKNQIVMKCSISNLTVQIYAHHPETGNTLAWARVHNVLGWWVSYLHASRNAWQCTGVKRMPIRMGENAKFDNPWHILVLIWICWRQGIKGQRPKIISCPWFFNKNFRWEGTNTSSEYFICLEISYTRLQYAPCRGIVCPWTRCFWKWQILIDMSL